MDILSQLLIFVRAIIFLFNLIRLSTSLMDYAGSTRDSCIVCVRLVFFNFYFENDV